MHRQMVEVKQGIRGRHRMRRRAAAIGLVLAVGVAGCGFPELYYQPLDGDSPIAEAMIRAGLVCALGDDLRPGTECYNRRDLNEFFDTGAASRPLIDVARDNGFSCKQKGKRTYCELAKKILFRPNRSGYPPQPGTVQLYTARVNFISGAPIQSADLQTSIQRTPLEYNVP